MKYPAYPNYKDSGVEWLGEVPEHWEVKGLRFACRFAYGDSLAAEAREDGEVLVYGSNGPVGIHATSNTGAPVIIIGRKGSFGKINYSKKPVFAIDTAYFIDASCTRSNLGWLKYALLPLGLDNASKDSAVPGLAREDAYDKKMPVPPVDEQIAIADFLDRETGRIDTLVAKKRRLIALLKEKRTALISRAVTRGLPADAAQEFGLTPHTRFKDSGIDWLGEVPEGWKIIPLGFLVRLKGGSTPDKSKSEYWDGEIPWVSPKDMKAKEIADSQDHVSLEALSRSSLTLLPASAVLIVVRGMILAHSFPVALTTAPVTINQDMKALICDERLSPQYLAWFLGGLSKVLVSLADESAHGTRKIETETITNFPVLLPAAQEQTAIATYLDRETAKLDQLVEKIETAIARLQEYRTALITAAVTGKIDVRQAVGELAA